MSALRWASILHHVGHVEPQTARKGHYLKCRCGCGRKAKYRAMFNGMCMAEGLRAFNLAICKEEPA